MTTERWTAIMARITPEAPADLDPPAPGLPPAPRAVTPPARTPSARLWQAQGPAPAWIGLRIRAALPDSAEIAARLCAAALERGVTPVILSYIPLSGFERFGFRVERITRPEDEEQLIRFWSLATIIEAADIAAMG